MKRPSPILRNATKKAKSLSTICVPISAHLSFLQNAPSNWINPTQNTYRKILTEIKKSLMQTNDPLPEIKLR